MNNNNEDKDPYGRIAPDALRAMIEEYITRDGTFYGKVEMSMEHKVDTILAQLKSGEAAVSWDLSRQTGNIVLKDDVDRKTGIK